MDNQDILLHICSRLDDTSLEKMSHTYLWRIIRILIQKQSSWYLRTQHLLGEELKQRLEESPTNISPSLPCWKNAYYTLQSLSSGNLEVLTIGQVLSNPLVISVLCEVNGHPSILGTAFDMTCMNVVEAVAAVQHSLDKTSKTDKKHAVEHAFSIER